MNDILPDELKQDRMIFKDINEINKKYGLNHNNFNRYLKFCNNKILDLNSKLNIKNIKQKSQLRKHLEVSGLITSINEEEPDIKRKEANLSYESKRIHYFLLLSVVICERDFQKANRNMNIGQNTLEEKLMNEGETEKVNKQTTDKKFSKCSKHFAYQFPMLTKLCSKRIVFDQTLQFLQVRLSYEQYKKKDQEIMLALAQVLSQFVSKVIMYQQELSDCKEQLESMSSLAQSTIKYLNFIDIFKQDTLDLTQQDNRQEAHVTSYISNLTSVDVNLYNLFKDGQLDNQQVISVKIIDPSKSFKFNNNIIIISNDKVITSIKHASSYLDQMSDSPSSDHPKMKQTAVQLLQQLQESQRIQQKLDLSDMIDFTNYGRYQSAAVQFISRWREAVKVFKTLTGIAQQFAAADLHGQILDQFVFTFTPGAVKVNDPRFRSLKKILMLSTQAKNGFQNLSMYSKDEENQQHNNMQSILSVFVLIIKGLTISLTRSKSTEVMNQYHYNWKNRESTLTLANQMAENLNDKISQVIPGTFALLDNIKRLLDHQFLDKLLVSYFLRSQLKNSEIHENLEEKQRKFPYLDPCRHVEQSISSKRLNTVEMNNVQFSEINNDTVLEEQIEEKQIISKLARLTGDNKVKDGLVKGLLKRFGFFGNK